MSLTMNFIEGLWTKYVLGNLGHGIQSVPDDGQSQQASFTLATAASRRSSVQHESPNLYWL